MFNNGTFIAWLQFTKCMQVYASQWQRDILFKFSQVNVFPSQEESQELTSQTGLSRAWQQNWFKERRKKLRELHDGELPPHLRLTEKEKRLRMYKSSQRREQNRFKQKQKHLAGMRDQIKNEILNDMRKKGNTEKSNKAAGEVSKGRSAGPKHLNAVNSEGLVVSVERAKAFAQPYFHREGPEHFTCSYTDCMDYSTRQAMSLYIHIWRHLDIFIYQCRGCPSKFNDRGNFEKHLNSKHDATMKKIEGFTHYWEYEIVYANDYKQTVKTGNADNSKNYVCDLCKNEFKSLKALQGHERTKHDFKCRYCHLVFNSKGIEDHITLVHEAEDKIEETLCKFCSENFNSKNKLLKHEASPHNAPCQDCSHRFQSPAELKTHRDYYCKKDKKLTDDGGNEENEEYLEQDETKTEKTEKEEAMRIEVKSKEVEDEEAAAERRVSVGAIENIRIEAIEGMTKKYDEPEDTAIKEEIDDEFYADADSSSIQQPQLEKHGVLQPVVRLERTEFDLTQSVKKVRVEALQEMAIIQDLIDLTSISTQNDVKVEQEEDEAEDDTEEEGSKTFECKTCLEIFASQKKLLKHSAKVHYENWSFEDETMNILRGQRRLEEEDFKGPFVCDVCQEVHRQFASLLRHLQFPHLFKCEYCNKKFNRVTKLEDHMNTQHDLVGLIATTQCGLCGETFNRSSSLARHIRSCTIIFSRTLRKLTSNKPFHNSYN